MYFENSRKGAPRDDAKRRRLCAHLTALGPRSVYEFTREVMNGADVVERPLKTLTPLEAYDRLDASVMKYLGADRLLVAKARP